MAWPVDRRWLDGCPGCVLGRTVELAPGLADARLAGGSVPFPGYMWDMMAHVCETGAGAVPRGRPLGPGGSGADVVLDVLPAVGG